jgi:hypothetical protein
MAITTPPYRILAIDVGIRALGVCIVSGSKLNDHKELLTWLRNSEDHTIEYWELINVLAEGGSCAKDATRVGDDTLLQMIRVCLQSRLKNKIIDLSKISHVVVELQHRVNHQMEALGMAIAGYLTGWRDANGWAQPEAIRMQSGLVKRKLFETTESSNCAKYPEIKQAPNPRLQNKFRALACVDWLLPQWNVDGKLSDAYAQAHVTRDQVRTKKGVKVITQVTDEKRDDMADALLHGLAKLWMLVQKKGKRKRARVEDEVEDM